MGETVRSEAEILEVKEFFVRSGDDPPAINTAVRDTLTWVLGGITVEELIEEYFVAGEDFQCFTCPAGMVAGINGVGISTITASPHGNPAI